MSINIEEANSIPIEQLNLSDNTYNALKCARVNTVGDIFKLSQKVKNLGPKGLQEIKAAILELRISHKNEEDIYNVPIKMLGLSPRVYHALKRSGIHTAGDIFNLSDFELRSIRDLGERALEEIEAVKSKFNISPRNENNEYIESLNLPSNIYNALARAGITTVDEFRKLSFRGLKNIRGLGEKSIAEILKLKEIIGLNLDENEESPIEGLTELERLGIPSNIVKALEYERITTIDQLKGMSEADLLKIRNIGVTKVAIIKEILEKNKPTREDNQEDKGEEK